MSSTEVMIRDILYYLAEGDRGPMKALEKFQHASTDVEKDLRTLFALERERKSVSLCAVVQFVEAMPSTEWIVLSCDALLEEPGRWDTLVVACILHRAMGFATGKTLMLAEMCWIQYLDDTTRAIASRSPVSLSSELGNYSMYAAGDTYLLRGIHRSIFCWQGEWTSDNNKELWRFVQVAPGSQNFYIVSVFTGEYLSSSTDGYDIKNIKGTSMTRVFVRRVGGLPDDSGIWRLVKSEQATYTLCNIKRSDFLASPLDAGDGYRRHVVTTPFRVLDEKNSACREWKISSVPTELEQGLKHFFTRKFSEAVQTFTRVLAMTGISAIDYKNILCYRMAANLILKNEGCFKEDLELVKVKGGFPHYFFGALAKRLSDEDRYISSVYLILNFANKLVSNLQTGVSMEPDDGNAIRWVGTKLGTSGTSDACDEAVSCFLRIRDVEYRGDVLLKNLLSTKRVQLLASQDAVLNFLVSLPNPEWTVVGCQFLLETGGRWNAVAVASLLDKVMAQARGKTLMLAEICWIRSVLPAIRALASNAPVTISSVLNNNMLIAAEDYFLYDETRRCVFCWADEWEADQSKEIWRFVPANLSFTDFNILNVYSLEYLFASDVAASETADGYGEKKTFTWRGGELPGKGGLWRLIPVDGAFAIYNLSQDTYLISPPASGSAFRRPVLTSSYRPLDQSWNECHKWRINPAAPSLLEKALDSFFAKDYEAAVIVLTTLLETDKPSPAASMKVYWYRMVANLRLQKKELFLQDAQLLVKMGGCPKYFLEVIKDVLGAELTAVESADLAQHMTYH